MGNINCAHEFSTIVTYDIKVELRECDMGLKKCQLQVNKQTTKALVHLVRELGIYLFIFMN